MFRGQFEHTMDAKGRVSIPVGFRNELMRRSDTAPVLMMYNDHLALYPQEDWESMEAQLLEMSRFKSDVRDFQRYLTAGAFDCPIDNNGRILIPPTMRNRAGLETKVTIAGVLDRIEIWSPERFADKERMTLLRLDEIQEVADSSRKPGGA